jgi:CTP:molybdopterin cytidylyltransferase MocA
LTDGVAAVVLAAGLGTRFGGDIPKPLHELGGRPLVVHALAAARGSGCAPVVVVVGNDRVDAFVRAWPDIEVVRNEQPEVGIATSLQAAVRALEPRAGVRGVVVGLADQPLVGAEAYTRVAAAIDTGAHLAYATYGGERANPVLVAREVWPDVLELAGDVGARVLFGRFDALAVPCDGTGTPDDVDTPADLANLESRWRSQTASE